MTIIKAEHWKEINLEKWKERWPNFVPWELACRGTGMLIMTEDFMGKLQKLRTTLDEPMHITSGCRSAEHNDQIDGKSKSFHICDEDPGRRGQEGCLAVDVATADGPYRGQLFSLAWHLGWTVGWNAEKKFLHLDRRIDVSWRQTSFDY